MQRTLSRTGVRGLALAIAALVGCGGTSPGSEGSDDEGSGGDGGGEGGEGGRAGSGSGGGNRPPAAKLPSPATPGLWRLTERQYQNALRDLLGVDLTFPELKAEQSAGGLAAIAAGTTTASGQEVERYELVAASAVAKVFETDKARQALVSCAKGGAPDAACTKTFLTDFGRKAFRRPLTTSEVDRYVKLAAAAQAIAQDAWVGLSSAVNAMVQSPKFLYRFEVGAPDAKNARRSVLNAHERASRLAFLLTDAAPDPELAKAADAGALLTGSTLTEHARRLWKTDRASKMWSAFIEENYRLDDLGRSAADVPPELLGSMRQEIAQLASAVVFQERSSFLEFFTRNRTFVDAGLRMHYGLPAGGAGFAAAQFPAEQERMGFFGSAAFLTLTSTSLHTSPTSRGKFIRERILCQEVPAPMAGVDTSLPPASETARTTRERLDLHRKDPTCASCHSFMDPPGYAFERFDQLGKYRSKENGADIRTDGSLDPTGKTETFKGPRELVELLVKDAATASCLSRALLRHSTGYVETRVDEADDTALVEGLARLLQDRRFALDAFFADFVASDAFITRKTEEIE